MILKLMYKDITEYKTSIMFMWYGQELKIESDNIEIKDYNSNKKISVVSNYKALFEHCEQVLNQLLKILDIDLFKAWDIYYNQENFSNIENWEQWENIESIEDLGFKINKYDETKVRLNKFIEEETKPLYR